MANFYDALTPKAELAISMHSALDQFLYPYGEAELDIAKYVLLSRLYICFLSQDTITTSTRTTSTRSYPSAMTRLPLSTPLTGNSSPASTRPSCVSDISHYY